MFDKLLRFHQQKQPRLRNCDTRDKMFRFCEAFTGWFFMFSSLIKNLSGKSSFFQLAFEAQPAYVSSKLLKFCISVALLLLVIF